MVTTHIGIKASEPSGLKTAGRRKTPVFTVSQLREYKSILKFLNEKDRDILYLIFVTRQTQPGIEAILGRSQPSICYDLRRIRKRLKFITYLNSTSDIFFDFIAETDKFTNEEIEVMTAMFFTTSYTLTSETVGIRQKKVGYVFNKVIDKAERLGCWQIYEILMAIRRNLNIVKRVYEPYEGGRKKMEDAFVPA